MQVDFSREDLGGLQGWRNAGMALSAHPLAFWANCWQIQALADSTAQGGSSRAKSMGSRVRNLGLNLSPATSWLCGFSPIILPLQSLWYLHLENGDNSISAHKIPVRISEVICGLSMLLPGTLSTQYMIAIRVILFLKPYVVKLHHMAEIVRAALIRHGFPDKIGSPPLAATPRAPWRE